MSFSITDAFIEDFSGAVRYIAQQKEARLERTCIVDTITGESAFMEQLAPTAAQKIIARHSDSPVMNTQHLRRRIAPYGYNWGDLIDELDKVALIIDPSSAYPRNAAFAMNRAKDDELLGALYAIAYTGHSGSTQVTWPNGNAESSPTTPAGTQVAVSDWTYGNGSGNAGLTISKLIYGMVALDAAEGDEDDEERFCVIKAKQKGNLLATTEATLEEFGIARADMMPLRDGKITKILNFDLIHSERVPLNSSGYTRVPGFRKSAMGLGIAKDISTNVAPRPDKNFSTYVYAAMKIGASRLEEAKLVELICA